MGTSARNEVFIDVHELLVGNGVPVPACSDQRICCRSWISLNCEVGLEKFAGENGHELRELLDSNVNGGSLRQ